MYKLFSRFMLIHNSVYVFLSGIFISLSTNLLTSLCFEPNNGIGYWCVFATIASSGVSGAMFIVVATELTPVQERIKEILEIFRNDDIKNGDPLQKKRKKVLIIELTENRVKKWVLLFLVLLLSTMSSIVFTILQFVLFC